ncbi:hypothetical protein [Massilia arenae]|uniref:Uncharacterized protein n=1 Tax=Massilia arenae TaxID=2603288 RepID=A0A5C7G1J2_9BURK|nr:hypothetical protein [Massilia arenae]TXF97819.1 hypothetical protein FVD38_18675 [Massilia arenae]
MSELERKWWFSAPVAILTVISTIGLLHAVGIQYEPVQFSAAQWAVWFLCFVGLQRCFTFLGWLAVLVVSPKTITARRA